MPGPCSPLRRLLCSRSNAVRVARRLTEAGKHVVVVATGHPLQPWRVIEADQSRVLPRTGRARCA